MASNKDYELFQLSNGLDVLLVPNQYVESVYVCLKGKVGRRAERDDEIGAAHFLEHLFFDGTQKRPSALEVNGFIESVGGSRQGLTNSDEVAYEGKVIKDNAEYMFDFISDIFQNSLLEEFEKERKVIAQEAAANRDDPALSLGRQRTKTMFPRQSVGRNIFDEETNLPHMTPDILRQYHQRTYTANNFVLGIAGNIETEEAHALAEKYFASIARGESFHPTLAQTQAEKVIDIENRNTSQSKLAISFTGLPLNHDTQPAMHIMRNLLGMGSSSRLYNRLRHEMNIAYFVGIRTLDLADAGAFTIMTFVDETNLQTACNAIIEEIQKLLDAGITDQELERAKNMYLSDVIFKSDNPAHVVDDYTSQHVLTGHVISASEKIENARSVDQADVMKIAREIFSDQPKVNIITPTADEITIPEISVGRQ
jgi:predicted Zn-dependent peptidase